MNFESNFNELFILHNNEDDLYIGNKKIKFEAQIIFFFLEWVKFKF